LTATAAAGALTLSWTGGAAPYIVQKKTSLSEPAWVDVLTTNETTASVQIQGPSGFFRIVSP
jgi:hypothetical protein